MVSPAAKAVAAAGVPVILYFLSPLLYPAIDPREPPVVRPRIPIVGHVISLLWEWTGMFNRQYKEHGLPICTLPMMGGKLYVVNKPSLIAAAMRNRALSLDAFSLGLMARATGMTPQHVEKFGREGGMDEIHHSFHTGLTGENLQHMTRTALADIAETLNGILTEKDGSPGLVVPFAFEWARDLLALASMRAFFGPHHPPFPDAQSLVDFWEYDQHVGLIIGAPFKSLLAGKGLAARRRCHERLAEYYVARHDETDEDVSALVRQRAAMNRRLGIPDAESGVVELLVPWLATTNTAPALFWTFIRAFGDADLTARIREEMAGENVTKVTQDAEGRRVSAVVDVARLEKDAPMLHAVFRESLRYYTDMVGTRIVLEDTTIRDPETGQEYLLRGGTGLQWPSIIPHHLASVWGDDVDQFRPSRFLKSSPSDSGGGGKEARVPTGAMIPFGGGRNLCPGRHLAQSEILGIVGAMALGFKVEGAKPPPSKGPLLATAMRRPDWGGRDQSLQIWRREGWENVKWSFKCGED